MTDLFAFSYFSYLGRRFDEIDIYPTVFRSAPPKIAAESPYLNAEHAGVSMALAKRARVIEAMFFYAEGEEGYSQFAGPLPKGLSFAMNRSDVRALLGEPAMAADAGGTGIMAIEHDFDRYENDRFYWRFEYLAKGGVRLMTLGPA